MGELRPQPRQEVALACEADIVLTGGAAGAGKTFTMLMSPLRWLLTVDNFYGVIFRRTTPQITAPGGLWDAAVQMYSQFDELALIPSRREVVNTMTGGRLAFRHLEREMDVLNWQGVELAFIGLDEATHFTNYQVTYLMSRMRTMCGIDPYMLMTCNPDAESWLLDYVRWYLTEDGYPDKGKADKIRYFRRGQDGNMEWHDGRVEKSKSFCFIPSSIHDNQALLGRDKGYLDMLRNLPKVERMRLLDQNWFATADAGMYLHKDWWQYLAARPQAHMRLVRYWDRASTLYTGKGDPDYTVGLLAGLHGNDIYVLDVVRLRGTPAMVQDTIADTARLDGGMVQCVLERDPGQAGVAEIDMYRRAMPSMSIIDAPVRLSKSERVWTASRMAEGGRLHVLQAGWTKAFVDECHAFGGGKGHDDQVDALSGAVNYLTSGQQFAASVGAPRRAMLPGIR